VFWPALIKAIGSLGKPEEQGRMYGVYYAINGLASAIINVAALYVCSSFDDGAQGFFWAVMLISGGTFLALLLMLFLFNDDSLEIKAAPEDRFKVSDIGKVIKMPDTWLLAFGIFVSYSIYSSNTYFNPFLIDVVGVTPTDSGAFTILRTYVFMLLAPLGGFLCDRVFRSTGKWYAISFGLMALMLVGAMLLPPTINPTLAGVYTLLPAAVTMAQYGVAWSIQRELNIPVAVMGTAIGISSFVNWSPDMFMHTLFGYWLDSYGNDGYTYIFAYLIALAVLGMILGIIITRRSRKKLASVADQPLCGESR
jgi:nitrate/nitrite transporter NarK